MVGALRTRACDDHVKTDEEGLTYIDILPQPFARQPSGLA